MSTIAFVVLVVFGSFVVATAEEPRQASGNVRSLPMRLAVEIGKELKLEMVLIREGRFMMGSPDSDDEAPPDEKPQHRVRITKPFYLGKYLVTQEQWEAVMGNNPSSFKSPKNPVEPVTWGECQQFLDRLNAKVTNHPGKFQLPSEAQWEYACKAGSQTRYYFGDEESKLGEYAWYEKNSGRKTHPVGQKKPNDWGLYDMHGNAWEWCQDWYDKDYYANSPLDDPTGPATGTHEQRVVRGGGCGFFNRSRRWSTSRSNLGARVHMDDVGLRVALVPVDEALTAAETTRTTKQITNSIGMKLTLVPSGEFMMGSGESSEHEAMFFNRLYQQDLWVRSAFQDELPQHRVRITQPFYLGTYHVTRGQFRQFVNDARFKTDEEKGGGLGPMGWNPEKMEYGFNRKFSWHNVGFEQTDEHPVVSVSWNDAVAFCKWLSRKEGKSYRLPTEAEWEYACRAGTVTRYYSGDDPETLAKVGNVADAALKAKSPNWKYTIRANDGYVFTAPVGKFKPNAFGLYDMHGNVWQWCSDWYNEDYYGKSATDNPIGPETGTLRIMRGGSWFDRPDSARSCDRGKCLPDCGSFQIGFRVVRNR